MNCKPGDLAVVVFSRTRPENVGRIVRCIKAVRRIGHMTETIVDCWIVDPDITLCGAIADECLRPIRDSDGEDETLTWAGKPQCVPA